MHACECGHGPTTHENGVEACGDCNCPFYVRDDYDEDTCNAV